MAAIQPVSSCNGAWQTPMRSEPAKESIASRAGSLNSENSTPRAGMTKSRREELELWREKKRQKLAESGSNQPPPMSSSKPSGAPRPSLSHETPSSFRMSAKQLPFSLASSIHQKTPLRPVPIASQSTSYNGAMTNGFSASTPCAKLYANERRPSYGLFVRDENIDTRPTPAAQSVDCGFSRGTSQGAKLPCTPMAHLTVDASKNMMEDNAAETTSRDIPSSDQCSTSESSPIVVGEFSIPQRTAINVTQVEAEMDICGRSTLLVQGDAPAIDPSSDAFSASAKSKSEVVPTIPTEPKVEQEDYDVGLLLLANDTLVQHLAELEARRLSECSRLRQERDELRLELRMQDARFKMHAQRLEDTMQEGLMQALARIQQLTSELEEARATVARLEKKPKTKKGQ